MMRVRHFAEQPVTFFAAHALMDVAELSRYLALVSIHAPWPFGGAPDRPQSLEIAPSHAHVPSSAAWGHVRPEEPRTPRLEPS